MNFFKKIITSSVLIAILIVSHVLSFASSNEQENLILQTYPNSKNIEFIYNDNRNSYARIYPSNNPNQYFIVTLDTNTKLIWIRDAYPNAFDYKFINGDRPYVRVYPTKGSLDHFIVYCKILDNGRCMINELDDN